jgi:hypothetical protein
MKKERIVIDTPELAFAADNATLYALSLSHKGRRAERLWRGPLLRHVDGTDGFEVFDDNVVLTTRQAKLLRGLARFTLDNQSKVVESMVDAGRDAYKEAIYSMDIARLPSTYDPERREGLFADEFADRARQNILSIVGLETFLTDQLA